MNETTQAFVSAFADEMEKIAVRAISATEGSRVKGFLAKMVGKPPPVVFKPKSTRYLASGHTETGPGMSRERLKRQFKQQLGEGGKTTPGGAPKSSRPEDIAASEKARAALPEWRGRGWGKPGTLLENVPPKGKKAKIHRVS